MNAATNDQKRYDAVIVGGGVAAMSSALAAARKGLRVLLVDERDEPGGVVRTRRAGEKDQYLIELGPNSFTNKPAFLYDMAEDLGLQEELLTRPASSLDRFLFDGTRLVKAPMGPFDFFKTPLVSWGSKLRVMFEFLRGGKRASEDPTKNDIALGTYFRSHFGDEFVDAFLVPFVSGIYAADPDRVSLRSTFPRLYPRLAGRRSFVAGMILGPKGERKSPEKKKAPRVKRHLVSFRDGLQTLPKAMLKGFEEAGGRAIFGAKGLAVAPVEDGGWRIEIEEGNGPRTIGAAQVVLATPSWTAARLVEKSLPELSKEIAGIESNAMLVAHVAVPVDSLAVRPEGFGFLVPRKRGVRLLGCIWSSGIFPGRAPEGEALLTCFFGGELDPEAVELSNEKVLETLRADLGKTMGWNGEEPRYFGTQRWRPCLPVYRTGHPARLERIRELLPDGLHLAGNYLESISMPEAAESGWNAGLALKKSEATGEAASAGKSATDQEEVETLA